jgi:TonB family protein
MAMIALLLAPLAAPPMPAAGAGDDRGYRLVVLRPGEATCNGIREVPVYRELPIPEAGHVYLRTPAHPVTLAFSIDNRGRAIDIEETSADQPIQGYMDDAAPSLAAWQFTPGPARTRCTISYSVHTLTAAEAPRSDVYYAFATRRGNLPALRPFYERDIAAGSDCYGPFPNFRLQAFPPYDELDRQPGSISWNMIGFDIDAKGRTRNVRLLGSDHDAALDDSSMDAVRASRFAPGAHHGCALPFRLFPGTTLKPPPAAPTLDYRAPDAQCEELPEKWASMPPLKFPEPFRRRSIEGWAIVRFDVAPWGETGNVEVVNAQPAAAFGEAAERIVRRAKKPPSPRGFSGCVDKVYFKMRPRRAAAETPAHDDVIVR